MDSKPKYPIFIVSKGRWQNPLTANSFNESELDYKVVVEPSEYENYVNKLGADKVLKLPFENLGLGSYPARNFCFDYSIKNGHKKHWVFDDNIRGFCKWINGRKTNIKDCSTPISYVERFSDKFNVNVAGFEYRYFSAKPPKKPFKRNVHVYSAMLIDNSIPFRWRLKYNEDVDLCLQILHNGGTTASCVYFLTNKTSTYAKMKGGNQDELYKGNDPKKKLLKAKTLEKVWPQYVKTVIRFNRIHHLIDWNQFK